MQTTKQAVIHVSKSIFVLELKALNGLREMRIGKNRNDKLQPFPQTFLQSKYLFFHFDRTYFFSLFF